MGFIINPYRLGDAGGGGGGGSCTTPNATFTGLSVSQVTTTGCYRRPVLNVTSVSHALASDSDLKLWVNCKLGNDTTSTFGAPSCNDTGNTLVQGKAFSIANLQSGVDLNYHDSTNAAAQDASDDTAIGWTIQVTAFDASQCPSTLCADAGGNVQTLNPVESVPYDGTAVYDGSTFPAFNIDQDLALAIVPAGGGNLRLEADVTIWAWNNSSSSGYDSIPSGLTIELQWDSSCDTSGGCGSYSWQDASGNGASVTASTGGDSQTVTIDTATCWNEGYLFARARLKSTGSCGTSVYTAWTNVAEIDVADNFGSCGGGGGGGGPP